MTNLFQLKTFSKKCFLLIAFATYSAQALEMNYILVTGQSLSTGGGGAPCWSTSQPYSNLRLNYNERPTDPRPTAVVPLVCGTPYGVVEQPKVAMGNAISTKAMPGNPNAYPVAISTSGLGGAPYTAIKKGTPTYSEALYQVDKMRTLLNNPSGNVLFKPMAVFTVHGEADSNVTTTQQMYLDWLKEWQSNYQVDINAITGDSVAVPMFHTQVSSFLKANTAHPQVALAQAQAAIDLPAKHVMVGPKYFLPYNANGANPHPINHGYRWMAEYYAKVYKKVIVDGFAWKPLSIMTAKRSGTAITVTMQVPVPPIQLDTTLVPEQQTNGVKTYGFSFRDGTTSPPKIQSVEITAQDQLVITLDKVPRGSMTNHSLGYAIHLPKKNNTILISYGNVRDSDPELGFHLDANGNPFKLHNWLLHSRVPVDLAN